ncbi:YegP family protein [Aurantibacter sp.]|uniref:YegP family protein n=1 Tax=Aurantibacter sp. TaxID=2807103 RepID=UPI003267DB41
MIVLDKIESGYTFKIQAESEEALMESMVFSTKEEVTHIINALTNSPITQFTFERKTNNSGKFLFNVKDSSGRLVGTSQLYNSEAGMQNGIKNLKITLASLKS